MVYDILTTLRLYIGDWGISIIATMLFVIIVRIGIAFVFKLFRLNIDYGEKSSPKK